MEIFTCDDVSAASTYSDVAGQSLPVLLLQLCTGVLAFPSHQQVTASDTRDRLRGERTAPNYLAYRC